MRTGEESSTSRYPTAGIDRETFFASAKSVRDIFGSRSLAQASSGTSSGIKFEKQITRRGAAASPDTNQASPLRSAPERAILLRCATSAI
jgi:hypothetical protein